MKQFILLAVLSMSVGVNAQVGYIKDFDYQVTDVSEIKVSKQKVFERQERKIIDLEKSICANRAHLWAYDMMRFSGINPGKIFIFFASSVWKGEKKGWMYHVAPYLVDNGTEYVMEAGYDELTGPLTVPQWLENETDGRVKAHECMEIFASDTDLTEYFYERYNLPEVRKNGLPGAKCYYRKVPGHYWFPTSIALHDLKKDIDGDEVEFDPKAFDRDDVYEACVEAASSKFGRFFGGGKDKCKKHLRGY